MLVRKIIKNRKHWWVYRTLHHTSSWSWNSDLPHTDITLPHMHFLFWRGSHVTNAFMHYTRTLVGPQRFISGSVVLLPNRRFASPFKWAANSQNFWRLSNTDAPVYVHRMTISPALCWRSSEREKKLSNRLAASSFFQNDSAVRSQISHWSVALSRPIFDWRHVYALHGVTACQVNNSYRTWWIARFPQSARFKHETHTHITWTEVGKRTGSPARLNELRTSKTFGASKVRTLSRRSTRPSSVHA